MTRAKDISKIVTDADLSGTLDVTGTVTAGGLTLAPSQVINLNSGADSFDDIFRNESENATIINARNKVRINLDSNSDSTNAEFVIGYNGTNTTTAKALSVGESGDISFYEDTGSTPKLFWDASAERLGIGTSSPSVELSIAGSDPQLVLWEGTDGASSSKVQLGTGAVQGFVNIHKGDGTRTVQLNSDGDTYLNGGSVGIGTSSPVASSLLTLKETNAGGDGAELRLINSSTTVESATQIVFTNTTTDTADSAVIKAVRTASGQDFRFSSDGTERMRIDSSGNVHIGGTAENASSSFSFMQSSGNSYLNFNMNGRTSPITNTNGCYIWSGEGATGDYLAGTLVLQSRSNQSRDIAFITGTSPTERMRINGSGNVGIGDTSPDMTTVIAYSDSGTDFNANDITGGLGIYNTNDTNNTSSAINFKGGSRHDVLRIGAVRTSNSTSTSSNSADFVVSTRHLASSLGERFRITSNGSVGIGTSSPATLLNLSATNPVLRLNGSTSGNCEIQTDGASFLINADSGDTASGSNIAFRVDNEECMLIDSARGQVQVPSNTHSITDVYESLNVNCYQESGGNNYGIFINGNNSSGTHTSIRFHNNIHGLTGSITHGINSTAYNTSSDYRLKENVTADWDATTRLKQLNPVRFNFIADADTTVDGFLAHEVQSVVPEAITGTHNEVDADGNPVYQGIDQSKLVPLLVKTIQELEARIVALETA